MAGEKTGQETEASRDFQLLITNAEEKKILCQCILVGEEGRFPYPGIPTKCQEDDFIPTNQSKTLARELKKGY